MFIIKNMWDDLQNWSWQAYTCLVIAILSITIISYSMGQSSLEFVSGLTGIIGVILIARGKLSGYIYGIIATGTYAQISFQYEYYGEAIAYYLLFLPMQFIGYYKWYKASQKRIETGKVNVIYRSLSLIQVILAIISIAFAIVVYAYAMYLMNGKSPGLDSATAILNIAGTVLMILRYREQWIAWIAVNITAIALWISAVLENDAQGWTILAMWVIYLINSIYGYYAWLTKQKTAPSIS